MTVESEVARMSASELASRLKSRELSPVELAKACLNQVERLNPLVNAICTVSETVIADAKRAEKRLVGRQKVPLLCGLPFGVKDITPTAGLRTTFGSKLFSDYVPNADALVVARLRESGGVLVGKTNTPEFAAGANTFNELFGATRNPWNLQLSAGGSTGGGAAALATGMIALAEGTDLGGSLRIPASFCGVVGLRPSPGLVPTCPSDFLWDSLSVTGPMARTVEDVALMLQAIAGPTSLSPLCQPASGRDFVGAALSGIKPGCRLAYAPDVAGIGIDSEIETVARRMIGDLNQTRAKVDEIEFDLSSYRETFLAIRGFWMVAHHHSRLDQLESFGQNLAGNVKFGLTVSAEQLAAAEQARGRLWKKFQNFFQEFDCLLTPCVAVRPFPVEENYPKCVAGKRMQTYVDWLAPTFVLSVSGLPVVSVPCGLDSGGLPVGLQVVGPPFGEEVALAVAAEIQEAAQIGLPSLC